MTKARNPHWGSTLDDFLEEEGIREEATTAAIKKVIAWQLAAEMKKKRITKKRLAELMGGSEKQFQDVLGVFESQRHQLDMEYLNRWVKQLGVEALWQRVQSEAKVS